MKYFGKLQLFWLILAVILLPLINSFNIYISLLFGSLFICILLEKREHNSVFKNKSEGELKKLQVQGTQPDFYYESDYNKKFWIVMGGVLLVVLAIRTGDSWTEFMINNKIFYFIITVPILFGLPIFFIVTKSGNSLILSKRLFKVLKKEYPNYMYEVTNRVIYRDEEKCKLNIDYKKIVENFVVEIPEINCKLVSIMGFVLEFHYDEEGRRSKIPVLYRNFLDYKYKTDKDITCRTNDFMDIPDFKDNSELINNVFELKDSRILEFKIENNEITIRKTIKNKGITKKDYIEYVEDIQIFKEKIVDVINK